MISHLWLLAGTGGWLVDWAATRFYYCFPTIGPTGRVLFGDLARHYITYERGELAEADDQKSHTTIERYLQILNNRLIPRWGSRPALEIEPLEIMQWLAKT